MAETARHVTMLQRSPTYMMKRPDLDTLGLLLEKILPANTAYAINLGDSWTYKGMMFSDVPNLVNTFGYINSSWTLRADLIAHFVCRLANKLSSTGMRQVTPRLREQDKDMRARPWVDGFSAGYFQRAEHLFPKQGDRAPWINCQNYTREKSLIGRQALEDGVLEFANPETAGTR